MTARSPDRHPSFVVVTAPAPGAVALIQLQGPGAAATLGQLTRREDWPLRLMQLVDLGGVDQGLAVVLGDDWAQLMPHGGAGVLRQLAERLMELGAMAAEELSPRHLFPEAGSDLEADLLWTLSGAASPAAIDLLMAQPPLWRSWLAGDAPPATARQVLEDSLVLDRLVAPPTVAVVGRPNVGKSMLSNRLLGRGASVVADVAGTTRDWVSGLAELQASGGDSASGNTVVHSAAVVVRWIDTPGLRRDTADRIEAAAIDLAAKATAQAELIVAMRDPRTDWPDAEGLPRAPDLWLLGKADLDSTIPASAGAGGSPEHPLAVSARSGYGLGGLQREVLRLLGLSNLGVRLWAFSATLREALQPLEVPRLRGYLRDTVAAKEIPPAQRATRGISG